MAFSCVEKVRGFGLDEYAGLPPFAPVEPARFAGKPAQARVGLFATVRRDVLRSTLSVADAPATPWKITGLPQAGSADRSWDDDVRALDAHQGKDVHRARVPHTSDTARP